MHMYLNEHTGMHSFYLFISYFSGWNSIIIKNKVY